MEATTMTISQGSWTREELPEWMREAFPLLRQINLGHCPLKTKGSAFAGAIAHSHCSPVHPSFGVVCFNPRYLAAVWSWNQPSDTLLHEYAHLAAGSKEWSACQRTGRAYKLPGHGKGWKNLFAGLLREWGFPEEHISRVMGPGGHCYMGAETEFLGTRLGQVQEPVQAAADPNWKDRPSLAYRAVETCKNAKHRLAIELRQAGKSYTEVAAATGMSQSAIYNCWRKYGLLNLAGAA